MLDHASSGCGDGARTRFGEPPGGPAWALGLQSALRRRRIEEDRLGPVRRIGGVGVAYGDDGRWLWAVVTVLAYPTLEVLDSGCAEQPVLLPYTPGLLALREAPAILAALEELTRPPDLLLVRGQGTAHPRRFGAACHVGVLADVPTIGVALTPLEGSFGPVPDRVGAWEPLVAEGGDVIGAVVRTRPGVRPVYVSPGHRVALETAVAYAVGAAPRYRAPEPLREARRRARDLARGRRRGNGGPDAAGATAR